MDFFAHPDIQLSAHELVVLERNGIHTYDLLITNTQEIAKKTQLSLGSINRIKSAILATTTPKLGRTALDNDTRQRFLTTGDGHLDELLGGGAPTQHITEFVGVSGVGKSQFMTQFCITAQLPISYGGLARDAVYISTESGLATSRAKGMMARYVKEGLLPDDPLNHIHVVVCPDLELQDHMIYYQLPVLLRRGKIGAVVIDSIAANYRAEHERDHVRQGDNMAVRTKELMRLAAHLRRLAVEFDLAIIVANQVSDRITHDGQLYQQQQHRQDANVLALDHQSSWFTGWHAAEVGAKVPALGLVWANAVHCRVALKRVMAEDAQSRIMKLVYSPFAKAGETGYVIAADGVRSSRN